MPVPRKHLDGADGQPPFDGRNEIIRGAIGYAEQRMRNASNEERGRDQTALGCELIKCQIGVGERPLNTLPIMSRTQSGDPGLDRGAAIRERELRGRSVGESQPPLGLRGPPRQRPKQAP